MLEAVSVALHAVRVSEMKGGETALVIGAGMIGLLTLQAAKAAGASKVLIADIDRTRLQTARKHRRRRDAAAFRRRTGEGDPPPHGWAEAWTWCSKRWVEKKPLPPRSRAFARAEQLRSSATSLPRSRFRCRLWSRGRFACRDPVLRRANIPRQWSCWPAGKLR